MNATEKEMTLFEHIIELRNRLLYAVIGLGAGVAVTYSFRKDLFSILVQPLCQVFEDNCRLITTQVAEAFFVHFKTALLAGFFLSSPWIFWQVWQFIGPALRPKEKRLVLPFILAASLMFVGGAFLGYFYVFPFAFEFFLKQEISVDWIEPTTAMGPYFSFAASLLFAFGVLFQIPVVVVFLNILGLVSASSLWKTWRYALVGIFALSAILTPADPFTMLMLGVPLSILYMGSLMICSLMERSRRVQA